MLVARRVKVVAQRLRTSAGPPSSFAVASRAISATCVAFSEEVAAAVKIATPVFVSNAGAVVVDETPVDVTFGDVSTANYRIRTGIQRTLMHKSRKMSHMLVSERRTTAASPYIPVPSRSRSDDAWVITATALQQHLALAARYPEFGPSCPAVGPIVGGSAEISVLATRSRQITPQTRAELLSNCAECDSVLQKRVPAPHWLFQGTRWPQCPALALYVSFCYLHANVACAN